jgi:lipopolysaccharide/colanic/teichoic acid biosynthesis glycosyltransferase
MDPGARSQLTVGEGEAADVRPAAAPDIGSEEVRQLLAVHVDLIAPTTLVVATTDADELESLTLQPRPSALLSLKRVNDVRWINRLFRAANRKLAEGGLLAIRGETLKQRRARMRREHPSPAFPFFYFTHFMIKRVMPKLPVTRELYFRMTRGERRVVSETEILGRLVYCGFEMVETREIDGLLHVVARKVGPPSESPSPSYGPLFKMERVGKEGRPIFVYKLRTMHPYSEYLQEYVYERNKLSLSGKFKDDFRITGWGKSLRKLWIDELPMLINWVRRDLKLVGVRPISVHYTTLYPPELVARRQKSKPGLIPPYYADLPGDFDSILESEERYLREYERRPLRTDIRYFFRATYNILFKRSRSG